MYPDSTRISGSRCDVMKARLESEGNNWEEGEKTGSLNGDRKRVYSSIDYNIHLRIPVKLFITNSDKTQLPRLSSV